MSIDPSARLSVAEVLTNLEEQMASHREKEAYHAEQEVFHREQRAHHVAEVERVARHYEAFKAVAGSAVELAARSIPAAPEPAPHEEELHEILAPGSPVLRSRLVIRLAEQQPADAVFSASSLAAEVNRRFGNAFKKPTSARLAGAALRRLCANGFLRVVVPGTPHHEARYAWVSPPTGG